MEMEGMVHHQVAMEDMENRLRAVMVEEGEMGGVIMEVEVIMAVRGLLEMMVGVKGAEAMDLIGVMIGMETAMMGMEAVMVREESRMGDIGFRLHRRRCVFRWGQGRGFRSLIRMVSFVFGF